MEHRAGILLVVEIFVLRDAAIEMRDCIVAVSVISVSSFAYLIRCGVRLRVHNGSNIDAEAADKKEPLSIADKQWRGAGGEAYW